MHFDLTRRFQSHPWQKQMKQQERKVTNLKETKKAEKPKGKVSSSKHRFVAKLHKPRMFCFVLRQR